MRSRRDESGDGESRRPIKETIAGLQLCVLPLQIQDSILHLIAPLTMESVEELNKRLASAGQKLGGTCHWPVREHEALFSNSKVLHVARLQVSTNSIRPACHCDCQLQHKLLQWWVNWLRPTA